MDKKKDRYYVDPKRFQKVLEHAIPHYKEYGNWGKYGDEIGTIILNLMNKIKNKSSFKNYTGYYWEMMQEKALINIFKYMHKYDLSRCNPFNYFSTIVHNAYKTALKEMTKKKVKELPYDDIVLTEIIDLTDYEVFDEKVQQNIDKKEKFTKIKKIADKDMIKEIDKILEEMD
jgi:hypothetical protein